jgi:hypothetical protein
VKDGKSGNANRELEEFTTHPFRTVVPWIRASVPSPIRVQETPARLRMAESTIRANHQRLGT